MAAAATVTAPTRNRQINDVFYVAVGAFPTIQSAINFVRIFNGGIGQIVVTFHGPDSTPINTLTGGSPGTMFITDLRDGMNQNWVWNGTNFIPSPDIQLLGFIAKGNPQDYPGGFTIASTAMSFDPAGAATNGNGSLIVTANAGKPMPAVSLVGVPSDGSSAQTFLRADKDPVSGFLHVRMPQALELNNGDGNINLWTGQPYGTNGSKGMTIDADPTTNGIDFQGKTIGGANDQAIRLNPAGGDVTVNGSLVRTFANTGGSLNSLSLSNTINAVLSPARNLFDSSRLTVGFLTATGGISGGAGFLTSLFMFIGGFTQIVFNQTLTATGTSVNVCFYNIDQTFISAAVPNGGSLAAGTPATVPAGAAFVRVWMVTGVPSVFMAVPGAVLPPTFLSYQFTDLATLGAIATKTVTAMLPTGMNVFDKTRVVTGALRQDGTVQTALNGFQTSPFIPVGGATNLLLNIIAYGSAGAPGFSLCFYEGDQSFLSAFSTSNTAANTPIPIPPGAGWVRFYMPVTPASGITPLVDINTVMVAYEVLPGSYQTFGYVTPTGLAAQVATINTSIATSQAVATTNSSALAAAVRPSVVNLFDSTTTQMGYLKFDNTIVNIANFVTSAYINVIGLSFITSNIIVDAIPGSASAIFYNADKTVLSSITNPVAAGTPIAVPAGAVWFRFWIATAAGSTRPQWYDPTTVMMVNGSVLPGVFKWFGYVTKDQLSTFAPLPLIAKQWHPMGDSITAKMSGLYQAAVAAATGITIPSQDARGGRRTDQLFEMYQVPGSPVATGNPATGVSTAGIINTTLPQAAGDGSVPVGAVQINQPGPWPAAGLTLAQVLTNVDLVTIFLGTNDTVLLSNLGTISDPATGTTYYSYLKAAIEGVLTAKPSVRLIWIIPYKTTALTASNYGIVVTAIQAVCALYGVPYVDLGARGIVNSITSATYLSDGVHPTTTGSNKMIAPNVKAGILTQL